MPVVKHMQVLNLQYSIRVPLGKLDEIVGDITITYCDLDLDADLKPRWVIYCTDESQKVYDISCGLSGVSADLASECEVGDIPLGILLDRMEEEPREVGSGGFWWYTVTPKLLEHIRHLFATYSEGEE